MSRRARFWVPLLAGAICLLLGGCSNDGGRHEVSGEVLYKGKPLDEGMIDFLPLDGQGTKSGASILFGEYRVSKADDKGLAPGRYKVSIIAGAGGSGAGKADPEQRSPQLRVKERIPPEYNVKSNVIREVTKAGPNRFDFKIP